jgi:YD repeat-containing protein
MLRVWCRCARGFGLISRIGLRSGGRGNVRRHGARWAFTLALAILCTASGTVVTGAFGSSTSTTPGNGSGLRPSAGEQNQGAGFTPKGRSLSVGGGSGLGTEGPPRALPPGSQAVSALFTATSRTYKTPQGTYTTTFYGDAVNQQEPDGTWKPINASTSHAVNAGGGGSTEGPTVDAKTAPNASHDCAVASNSPTTSICNATTNTVGYDGTNTDNSLVEFELKTVLPSGANILNAQLGMYLGSASTTNAVSVTAYAATKPWNISATWNTYDGTNAWSSPGGDFSATNAVVNPSVTTPVGWKYWYPTQIVQEWVNGTLPNDGLLLADTTQKTTNDMLSFNSLDAGSNHPVLTVSWRPRGEEESAQYSLQSFALDDRSTMKVNLASGDLIVAGDDLAVKGLGVPFLAEHNYDSLNTEGGTVNPWYSLPGAEVYADGSVGLGLNRYDFVTFIKKSDGSFLEPAGINASLCAVNGTTCTANSVDTTAAYALTINEAGPGPLYAQGNKIDFASNGGILSDADRYGHAIVYHYGTSGISSISDTQGRTFTRTQTETGGKHVTSAWTESGTGGREVKYAYNAGSDLETYTDALGHTTKYAYDEENELKEVTDPRGNVTKLNYDTTHRITKVTLPEVEVEVEKEGKREKVKQHPTWEYTYLSGTDKTRGSECNPTTGIATKTVVKDPNGHETTFCSNVEDEVLQSFDAEGHRTSAAFNTLGEQTTSTSAAPGSGESGANVFTTIYSEEGAGAGRPMCSTTASESASTKCPESVGGSSLTTLFGYEDKANPFLATKTTDPQSNNMLRCYNDGAEGGCPATRTGPSGTLQNVNDGLAEEHELSFTYNETGTRKGTIASSTDARKQTTTYEYDEKGNLTAIKPPASAGLGNTAITVDSASRPHVITDGAKHVETITYDKLDRITEVVYSGTGTERTVKYDYDSNGNMIKRVDPTGTTKYTVNAINSLTKEELPGALSNTYTYDPASNMASFTDGGGTTNYTHNKLNELEAMTEPGEATPTKFAYDNDHRLTQITYPSGAKEIYKLQATTGRPEAITVEGTTGATVPNLSYSYTQGANNTQLIQSLTESTNNTTAYTYDPLNRLKTAISSGTGANKFDYEFWLDGDGNRVKQKVNLTGSSESPTSVWFDVNNNNLLECRQTVSGACTKSNATELSAYGFDEAGEETAITPKGDTSGSTFAYNAARELSSITPSGGSAQALSYGGAGQDDLVGVGSSTLQNSVLGLTREVSSAGTSYYARTPDGMLIDQRTPSGKFNPLYDAQGDVIALVSSAGKVERTFHYGPYGENVKSEGTQTIPYPFGYKSGYRMPGGNKGEGNVTNGLLHFGQRYYDPTTGRWTQGGFDFASADPVNLSDPSGLLSLCIGAELGGGGEACVSVGSHGVHARGDVGFGIKAQATVGPGEVEEGGQYNASQCAVVVCENETVKDHEGATEVTNEESFGAALGLSWAVGYGV